MALGRGWIGKLQELDMRVPLGKSFGTVPCMLGRGVFWHLVLEYAYAMGISW